MRVLFLQPPIEDFYTTPIRFYPLGLLYGAAVVEKQKHTVCILDCLTPFKKRQLAVPSCFSHLMPLFTAHPFLFKSYYRFGLTDAEILQRVQSFNPDVVAISSHFTAYYEQVEKLVRLIKRHFKTVIMIGGHHATVFADDIKKRTPEIDCIVQGPIEQNLPLFLKTRDGNDDWRNFLPAHHLVPKNSYKIGRKNSMSLTASRGCVYHCAFCGIHKMFGRRMEYRSAGHILREMQWNYLHNEVRIFNFEDDNLAFDRDFFCGFLQEVIADPLLTDIELTAMNGFCYSTLDHEMLGLMRLAGFKQINVSLVTHDEQLRGGLGRPGRMGEFEQLVKTGHHFGFRMTVYVIIGLPGQSFSEVKDTVDYLLGLGVLVGPSVFYIPPGSDLYDRLALPRETLADWNLYRSSAFAVETPLLDRNQLVELFSYVRARNLAIRSIPR